MALPVDQDCPSFTTGARTGPIFSIAVLSGRLCCHRPVGQTVDGVGRAVGAVGRTVDAADRAVGPSAGVAAEPAVGSVLVLSLALRLLALSSAAVGLSSAAVGLPSLLVPLSQGLLGRGYFHVGVDGGVDGEHLRGFVDGLILLLLPEKKRVTNSKDKQ